MSKKTIIVVAILIIVGVVYFTFAKRSGNNGPSSNKSIQFFISLTSIIKITDPLGRELQYLPDSSISFSQIPNSSYWTDLIVDPEYKGPINRDPAEFVLINNSIDGKYSINLTGTKVGNYTIEITGDEGSKLQIHGSTTPDTTDTYILKVEDGLPLVISQMKNY